MRLLLLLCAAGAVALAGCAEPYYSSEDEGDVECGVGTPTSAAGVNDTTNPLACVRTDANASGDGANA